MDNIKLPSYQIKRWSCRKKVSATKLCYYVRCSIMMSLISFIVDSDTCDLKMQMEHIIVFPWQHWIHERVTILYVHCLKAHLDGSPRLINAVESTKVNRVNSSFQRKWSTGLTGEQVGNGQLLFNVDSL